MPTADSPPIPVEDVSMSDRKRVAEGNAGAFLGPDMLVPAPMNALNDGPGRPGPEDDWKMPPPPLDEIEGKDDVSLEPVDPGRTVGLARRPTHKG
jgi:hypothetical protein